MGTKRANNPRVSELLAEICAEALELRGDETHCLACPLGADSYCSPTCAVMYGINRRIVEIESLLMETAHS